MTREALVKTLLARKYPNEEVHYNYRPEWLKNPRTGYNLELDIYYPSLCLAVEIQGLHHGLNYQSYKDEVKKRVCAERGIRLYALPLKTKKLRAFIKEFSLDTHGLSRRVQRFGAGTPSRGGKMWKYYESTSKLLKWEAHRRHLRHCVNIQKSEEEGNRKRKQIRELVNRANRPGME